jgi:S-formylglutathione hydrolase FrmB
MAATPRPAVLLALALLAGACDSEPVVLDGDTYAQDTDVTDTPDTPDTDTEEPGTSIPGTLRQPTGTWSVGARVFSFETTRPEIFTSAEDDLRELTLTIFYPASSTTTAPMPWLQLDEFPPGVVDHLAFVQTHAIEDADVGPTGDLPVVFYNPGAHAYRHFGSFGVEELASRGYVVVCLEHPGYNLPTDLDPATWDSNRPPMSTLMPGDEGFEASLLTSEAYTEGVQLPVWIDDNIDLARWLIDRQAEGDDPLFARMDLDRLGAFGWSMGGSTSMNLPAAFEDEGNLPHVAAVASLDGLTRGPITQEGTGDAAALFVHAGDAWDEPTGPAAVLMTKQQEDITRLVAEATAPVFSATLTGSSELGTSPATHGDFSDLARLVEDPGAFADIEQKHHAVVDVLNAFFDDFLVAEPDEGSVTTMDGVIDDDPRFTNTRP